MGGWSSWHHINTTPADDDKDAEGTATMWGKDKRQPNASHEADPIRRSSSSGRLDGGADENERALSSSAEDAVAGFRGWAGPGASVPAGHATYANGGSNGGLGAPQGFMGAAGANQPPPHHQGIWTAAESDSGQRRNGRWRPMQRHGPRHERQVAARATALMRRDSARSVREAASERVSAARARVAATERVSTRTRPSLAVSIRTRPVSGPGVGKSIGPGTCFGPDAAGVGAFARCKSRRGYCVLRPIQRRLRPDHCEFRHVRRERRRRHNWLPPRRCPPLPISAVPSPTPFRSTIINAENTDPLQILPRHSVHNLCPSSSATVAQLSTPKMKDNRSRCLLRTQEQILSGSSGGIRKKACSKRDRVPLPNTTITCQQGGNIP